jgi:hypothetical protein
MAERPTSRSTTGRINAKRWPWKSSNTDSTFGIILTPAKLRGQRRKNAKLKHEVRIWRATQATISVCQSGNEFFTSSVPATYDDLKLSKYTSSGVASNATTTGFRPIVGDVFRPNDGDDFRPNVGDECRSCISDARFRYTFCDDNQYRPLSGDESRSCTGDEFSRPAVSDAKRFTKTTVE